MTAPQTTAQTLTAQRKVSNARLRRALFEEILNSPRGYALKRRQRSLLKQLMAWVNPLTGHLKFATMNATLERELAISTRTLARARRELIELGLLIGYQPGDGRHPGRYTIARSWAEADEAAAERRRNGGTPYFPPNPQRVPDERPTVTPRATPQQPAPPAQVPAPRRRPAAAPPPDPGRLPAAAALDDDPIVRESRERQRAVDQTSPLSAERIAAQEAARAAARANRKNAPPTEQGGRPAA